MRSRARFRMKLYREDGEASVPYPLQGVIVQVGVRDLDVVCVERIGINTESVVLDGDVDLSCGQIHDWVIRPVVTELHLECLSSKGQAEDLLSQTDTEEGYRANL